MRRGMTLIELCLAIALTAVLLAVGASQLRGLRDRASVRSATTSLVSILATARQAAIANGRTVAAHFDSASTRVTVRAGPDTFGVYPLAAHGVVFTTTRDSIAYGPTGLGYGASTATIRLWRGAAEDTVIVSRLGRVRH